MRLDGLLMHPMRQYFWHLTTVRFWRPIAGMNPHILIVVAKEPPGAWKDFAANSTNKALFPLTHLAEPNAPTPRLSENIWLIPLRTGLPFAGEIRTLAQHLGLPCKLLYFEDEPNWLSLGDTHAPPPAA
jgi:hypothetical protein